MATYRPVHYTYGEYDEIAFTSRNDMNLAVWEGQGKVRMYSYTYEDTFRERVGRFLHNGLTQLWDLGQLCDLQVVVGEQVFQCHGIVLASVSAFFRSQLTSEALSSRRQPGEPDTLVLDEGLVTPDIFQLLLQLIYKGKDVVTDDNALDLLKAVTYLRIRALEFRCMDVITKQIGESTCMKIWDWAEKNNIPTLASKAKGVALGNFLVLRHTEDFLRVPLERLTLMLGHELLNYRNEDDILEAILDWVQFRTADRRQHLKELLPYVCFPYLSTRYLNELRKHDLIGLRSDFASYVDEALTYHLATLQKDGKKTQMAILRRQAHSLKRLMPGMRRVVLLIGGAVVQEEPLTNVVACYLDMAHPQSRYREVLQFSIASLPLPLGLRFASSVWKHDIYVSGGSRAPDVLLVYKPHENAWHRLKAMPQGREDHAMVAADGKLYILGGRTASKGGDKVLNDILLYDIEADAWRPAGELPVAVEAAPAVLFSDKVYVFGGRTESGSKVDLIQRLDLATGQSQVVGVLPQDVEGAKAIVLGMDIVLVCPEGAIYTVHEASRSRRKAVTFSDNPEYEDDLLASLESMKAEGGEATETPAPLLPPSDKGAEAADSVEVDWAILDSEGKERVPNLKRASGEEDPTPTAFSHQNDSSAVPDDNKPKTHAQAAKDDTQKIPAAGAKKIDDSADDHHDKEDKNARKDAELNHTPDDSAAAADDDDPQTDHKDEKDEEPAAHLSDQTSKKKKADDFKDHAEDFAEDILEGTENEERQEEDEEDESEHPAGTISGASNQLEDPELEVVVSKITTMEKRRDFGLFIRKADVMVVGGQSENGFFLDDILKIHIPTGQVCKTDSKLLIPVSGMQVESTAIHQNYLVQFFDATSCFYGE